MRLRRWKRATDWLEKPGRWRGVARSTATRSSRPRPTTAARRCLAEWNTQRREAHANARTVLDGPGRLGLRRPTVNRASEALVRWADAWRPVIPTMPTERAEIARFADWADDSPRVYAAVQDYARRQAQAGHREHARHVAQAAAADHDAVQARGELLDARGRHQRALSFYGNLGFIEDADGALTQIERRIATSEKRLAGTRERIAHLEARIAAAGTGGREASVRVDTSRLGLPADALLAARRLWLAERNAGHPAAQLRRAHGVAANESPRESQRQETWRRHEHAPGPAVPDRGISR